MTLPKLNVLIACFQQAEFYDLFAARYIDKREKVGRYFAMQRDNIKKFTQIIIYYRVGTCINKT
jgi:hypothetical protein